MATRTPLRIIEWLTLLAVLGIAVAVILPKLSREPSRPAPPGGAQVAPSP